MAPALCTLVMLCIPVHQEIFNTVLGGNMKRNSERAAVKLVWPWACE